MNREEKSATIDEIASQIEGAEAIFAVDYRGISVSQASELRGKLREADASFRIVKNRLTKIAAEKVGEGRLGSLLEGPTALAFVRGDTAGAAKAITTFNKEHEVLAFKGGFMADLELDEDKFKSIARLPGREVLNGQLAGVVASPLTGLVRGLGSMIQGLALQLGQIAEKWLVTGDAPAERPAGPVADDAGEADAASSDDAGDEASEGSDASDNEDAPDAGGAVGGTAPEDASATGGGGGSPAATGPASQDAEPSETAETDKEKEE